MSGVWTRGCPGQRGAVLAVVVTGAPVRPASGGRERRRGWAEGLHALSRVVQAWRSPPTQAAPRPVMLAPTPVTQPCQPRALDP